MQRSRVRIPSIPQFHVGYNFEATKLRDSTKETEVINRGVLLIRVNNQTTSIDDQNMDQNMSAGIGPTPWIKT